VTHVSHGGNVSRRHDIDLVVKRRLAIGANLANRVHKLMGQQMRKALHGRSNRGHRHFSVNVW
jgi:hypothetical protein